MTIEGNSHLVYLIDQIRSNLLNLGGNEMLKETPRAHAWLLTTLSIYGDQFEVLIELYRLFREQNSYILLSFIIEHILQYHLNEIETNTYLQQEFQLIFSNEKLLTNEISQFSYSRLYSLLSISTREIISSLLIRKWSDELEGNLLLSTKSLHSLNQSREKALACLALSSTSISSILQLIINTETKIGFNTQLTSLNILRCLFVQDLLPIVLENRQKFDIQSHLCHKWLIYAIEFYLEYLIKSLKTTNNQVKLEGNENQTFQCENPINQIEKLIHSAINVQQNFNWQQFLIQQGNQISSNSRQKLLELRLLLDRTHNSTIHCPLECYFFTISFPIYIQSLINLSNTLKNEIYTDYLFIHSKSSIEKNEFHHLEFIEHFYSFVECLTFLQQSQTVGCLKLYQETIEKFQLNENLPIYQRLLKIFYFYYLIQKSKNPKESKENKTIIIDDTPQSPTMQDDSNSPLICPDLETFIQQLNDQSLESRLQLCALFPLSHQQHSTVSFCIDTLIYLHDNYSSKTSSQQSQIFLSISLDYCFIPRSYPVLFDYLLDLLLQHLPPTLILLQIKQQQQQHSSASIYPSNLFSTLTPLSLRYIYDQKLLGQLLKYIQTTNKTDRRWISNNNKRKLDSDQNKLTDEQFIEKIIQHVSNITQWTDEQRRSAIYTYIIDERQTLLQSF